MKENNLIWIKSKHDWILAKSAWDIAYFNKEFTHFIIKFYYSAISKNLISLKENSEIGKNIITGGLGH